MSYKSRKVFKKQRRCEEIIKKECRIESSASPTCFLAVLNAGLSTGLTEEQLLHEVGAHGEVKRLLMLVNKSYSFLECASSQDAERIFEAMHASSLIGQNGAVVFLSYFQKLPEVAENIWLKKHPTGLIIIPDFVSEAEEAALLLASVDTDTADEELGTLKHRRVKHFGYEFLYGSNNVDATRPLKRKIPMECDVLWPRLQMAAAAHTLQLEWAMPDQLTVNEYEPGHGIPPHVDTHSAFLDPILSLSLQSDVVMEFRRGTDRIPVILPRRSLLIMSGEARYDWTHGITARYLDVVPTETGSLTTKVRTKRTSFTFRKLRLGPCACSFPTLCDTKADESAKRDVQSSQTLEKIAVRLEELNVHMIYDKIAEHFSETRHTPWPQVVNFLKSFEVGSVILDVGCGNGKYLNSNASTLLMGCDRSIGLLKVCKTKNFSTFKCDCLDLPIRSQSLDGCFSIAVIHHLSTFERRLKAVREMTRVLRQAGRGLIYVWAKDQRANAKKSSYLLQNKAINKQKTTQEQQRQVTAQNQKQQQQETVNLPIHTNRTDFLQQDVLVPWKLKGTAPLDNEEKTTFLRYYHVFEQNELEHIVSQIPELKLLSSYYDQGNHCVIFERI